MSEGRLVRVPTAFGAGGEAMTRAAMMDIGVEEAAIVAEATVSEQTQRVRSVLPERAVVLGGCCCTHVGAVAGLADRAGRVAVVWIDAHGDLNTPQTSPSGNEWGMPFRMILDDGHARVEDSCLIGARSLDPPEQEFIADQRPGHGAGVAGGVWPAPTSPSTATSSTPARSTASCPSRTGSASTRGWRWWSRWRRGRPILGMGLTGLVDEPGEPGPPAATAGRCGPRLSSGGLGLPVRVGAFHTLRGV